MDFVILDKVLTTLSFITPFFLYGGIFYNLIRLITNRSVSRLPTHPRFHQLAGKISSAQKPPEQPSHG
jgi:hypothetical protein